MKERVLGLGGVFVSGPTDMRRLPGLGGDSGGGVSAAVLAW